MDLPASEATTPRDATLAVLAVGIAVITWGWSNVASKTVSTTGLVISFYRLWFAVPALWIIPLVSPSIRARLDRRWVAASLVGGLLFGVHQLFFFTSLKQTSVATVSIVGSLQPALVLLVAGRMFGERITRSSLGWSAVALAGTAIVIVGASDWPILVALALVSAFVISILFLGTPVLASAGAAVFLGETLGPAQIAGGMIVLGAIAKIVRSTRSERVAEELAESAAGTDAP